ncbi:hypothetical protein SAMN05443144_12433 [Fodinibius roseus]|uniref:AsmA-like C-terminal region n=1 Tax=Fodinibius roseus TaxID=1194090 RepID=A0A1M5IQV8_9BACT|nr:hypothetical protein [Fodinibius roseus]SHG30714.1 hypothetical protein SAMN05443144_12433 [Fodinibius roseus]
MPKTKIINSGMNPLVKGILYLMGGLLVLLLILQIFITFFADDYLSSSLKEQVRQSTDSTYTLSFENLNLNVFSGSATISKARLQADTSVFSGPSSSSGGPPDKLFEGTFEEIEVTGMDLFSSLTGDELSIGTIRISRPDISALRNPHNTGISKDSSRSSSLDSTILAAISGQYRAIEIGELIIQEGYGTFTQSGDTISSLGQLDLSLRNIRVDSASAQSGRIFITDEMEAESGNFMLKLSDSLNVLRFDRLSISSDDETISLDSLQLVPRYGKLEFARRHGSTIDRIALTIPDMQFKGLDFSRLVDSARVYARYGHIQRPELEDYLNRGIAGGPPTSKPLPFIAFRDLKTPVKIDSLRIEDAYISYSEYVGNTPRAGTITFEETDAVFRSISNYPEDTKEGITTTLDAESRVMGMSLLEAHFEFPMDTGEGFHKVSGQLQSVSMPAFNRMLEHVAFIRVDRGQLNSLEFEMTLNENQSSGTLVMNYEDFKISVLDKQSIQQHGLLENLKSFVANNFVVRANNTPETGMRAGRIRFERDTTKSIFNYWWKSLLSGIKSTIRK